VRERGVRRELREHHVRDEVRQLHQLRGHLAVRQLRDSGDELRLHGDPDCLRGGQFEQRHIPDGVHGDGGHLLRVSAVRDASACVAPHDG